MDYDVAIIGAGPAGAAAAYDLLTHGLSVLIVDKTPFPRKKACAGGVTPKCFNSFAYDISSMVKQVCKTIKVTRRNQQSFDIKSPRPLCHMTERRELDLFCLNKAIGLGADFQVRQKICSVDEKAGHVDIHFGDTSVSVRYLIGADGSNSTIRRLCFKDREQVFDKQMALEADIRIDCDSIKMEFDFSLIKNGYYWIFPKKDHANIGVYSTDPLVQLKTRLLRDYALERFGIKTLHHIKGYPICTGGFQYQVDSRRIFLAGDAAGMAERMLGEGLFFAVKTGREVAASIIECSRQNVPAAILYQRALKDIKHDLMLHHWASRCLYRFSDMSLKALSIPFIHTPFAKGYADGKPLRKILASFVK